MPRPASYPRQVDATTCGIAALAVVAARSEASPDYLGAGPESIVRHQKALHVVASRVGMPWPRSLGTSPWALARLASAATGRRYRSAIGRRLRAAIDRGLDHGDVFVYTGGGPQWWSRWIPRHVVAVLADGPDPRDGCYDVYEPSSGLIHRVDADGFLTGAAGGRAARGNWRRALLVLAPEPLREGPTRACRR
ncbi:hypothetical protein M3T53_08630 [Actinomyces sp. B33]|uniref:hypothetical protein n=1 Tax=Actinomyces sp. B33 TaxID=2942131 RepID=UPI002340A646|nr:hypothetical protein [Actinomyces sp. B33]MDC4233766.1 hypothetical protein [Actinomyces sp. B33]